MFVLKGYAISAMTKIYAFEIAAGRKVDMLPEVSAKKILVKILYLSPIVMDFL